VKGDKAAYVAELRALVADPDHFWDPIYKRRGVGLGASSAILLSALADYLEGPHIVEHDGCSFFHYLPRRVADAFDLFLGGASYHDLRERYRAATGEDLPSWEDAHVGGLHRVCEVQNLCYHLAVCAGESHAWMRSALTAAADAQRAIIDQAWRRFVRRCYRPMMARMKREGADGYHGEFGETRLETGGSAGRVCFEFRRPGGRLTYVADDSDLHGERSGANTTTTPYAECVAMIDEVVALWRMAAMERYQ
jgi:hypothetical protein